jgi:hypothetical protein
MYNNKWITIEKYIYVLRLPQERYHDIDYNIVS